MQPLPRYAPCLYCPRRDTLHFCVSWILIITKCNVCPDENHNIAIASCPHGALQRHCASVTRSASELCERNFNFERLSESDEWCLPAQIPGETRPGVSSSPRNTWEASLPLALWWLGLALFSAQIRSVLSPDAPLDSSAVLLPDDGISAPGYHNSGSDHAQAPVFRISRRWRAVAGIRPDYAKMFGLQSPDPRDEMRERERGFSHPTHTVQE